MINTGLMQETLGEYIARRRKEIGLTQRALAKKARVSSSTLSRIELDVGKPGSATLERLADALSIPMSNLADVLQGRKFKKEPGQHPIVLLLDPLPPKVQKTAEKMLHALIPILMEDFKNESKRGK